MKFKVTAQIKDNQTGRTGKFDGTVTDVDSATSARLATQKTLTRNGITATNINATEAS